MLQTEINWDEIPETISKEQLYKICHIAKDTARRLLLEGIIPCEYTGKKTRCYSIKKSDVKAFVESPAFCSGTYLSDERKIRASCAAFAVDELPKDTVIAMKEYFTRKLSKSPDVFTVAEIAALTGYSHTQINKWCSSGKLKSFKRQKRYFVPKIFLVAFFCSTTFRAVKNKSAWHRKTVFDFSKHFRTVR